MTSSCCSSVACSTRWAGDTRIELTCGAPSLPQGAPWATHWESRTWSGDPVLVRAPPPWAIALLALPTSRLPPGAARDTRRPRASLTRALKSALGSNPKTLSLNPFWPLCLPCQPPLLQPSFERIGMMSLLKCTGGKVVRLRTRTGTSIMRPP